MPTATTMNDYQRRFQRSLQKLTTPTWYTDAATLSSNKIFSTSKQSILSSSLTPWRPDDQENQRTPEIVHVRRPHSYRSCRSSLATSPSPSVRSWHPTHMMDGVNFSLLLPSSSSSSSRRDHKYEKGIERVSKSSRWYQPTPFVANKITNNQTGTRQVSTSTKHKQQFSSHDHYDIPKLLQTKTSFVSESNRLPSISNNESTSVNEQNSNMITNDKQQDNHTKSNDYQTLPLAIIKEPFSAIELEDITDEEDDRQRLLAMIEKNLSTNPPLPIEYDDKPDLLQRTADDLVESILADLSPWKDIDDDDDDDDQNSGVRELSEDENGLRELDENDINDTDEFILFATNADTSEDEISPSHRPRYSLNRLYTFSKVNENSPRSTLESDVSATTTCPSSCEIEQQQQIRYSSIDQGVNEETARIGRLLLDSIPTELNETSPTPTSVRSIAENTRSTASDHDGVDCHRRTINEELKEKVRRDSAYSSNQERIHLPQTSYEPLSECYSGYSFVQSDFLSLNISSVQSTTDEAYESEPTTVSSSIAPATTHVHPNLEHEFEYPSPPPPVPDRRLKPAHLKSSVPTKARLDSAGYTLIQKPRTSIQQLITATSNNTTSSSTKTMSSRYYCGSIPVPTDNISSPIDSIVATKSNGLAKDRTKEKRSTRTLSCLHPSTTDDNHYNEKRNSITKSSSSLNKMKMKKQKLITDFDVATNGLAIRLPAPVCNGHDLPYKQNLNRMSTPVSTPRTNGMRKKSNSRPPLYETSV